LCSHRHKKLMAIIISQNGKNAKRIDKSSFEKEDYLQGYIYDNPESIPLYEFKEDIKLLILAREFPTDSGPIDAIGVDKEGEIYLIETKLYKNADKRLVVAQVLDYGASLWRTSVDFNDFSRILDEDVYKKWNMHLHEKLEQFFETDPEDLVERMKINLNKGGFKFVVLMDKLHSQLRDLIVFLNENSRFDVFAVELEYYKHQDYEIMIPKLFGAEVKKDIAVSSGSGARRKWNEELMLENAKQKFSPEELILFERIYNFSKETADAINFGTGAYATFSPIFEKLSSKSLFTLGTDKHFSFNFEWVGNDNPATMEKFKEALEKVGFKFKDDYRKTRPSVYAEDWAPKTDKIIGIIKKLLE